MIAALNDENLTVAEVNEASIDCSCKETALLPNVPSDLLPHVDMEFESIDDAYQFYNSYALAGGFDICIRDSKKKQGVEKGFKKQRGNERKEYASTRYGCNAWLFIALNIDTKK
ncbi:FAR1-RELATED SEQUENCE 8 protein [Nymphaea thermarum]|nr:FAR1-RELATED SEQUENCE 8 protein [Nymphaea thermarum]